MTTTLVEVYFCIGLFTMLLCTIELSGSSGSSSSSSSITVAASSAVGGILLLC